MLVEDRLKPCVQLLPLREQVVQLYLAQHRTQAGLCRLLDGVAKVFNLNDGLGGIHHPEVDNRIHLQ